MFFWSVLFGVFLAVHHVSSDFVSCKDMKVDMDFDEDGIQHLRDKTGYRYQAYCDMTTDGGGWTLVASIHENNIKGRCTVDDLWSSQQGRKQANGDGNWNNRVIFGTNPGYYDIEEQSLHFMVWHVPNITPLYQWKEKAYLRYRTTSLTGWSDNMNLYSFFKTSSLERKGAVFSCQKGTVLPITYDKGGNDIVRAMHGSLVNDVIEPGYFTVRPVGNVGVPFAFCSGVKAKEGTCSSFQHFCFGGGGYHADVQRACGDFNCLDGKGEGQAAGWDASSQLTDSSILIFYR